MQIVSPFSGACKCGMSGCLFRVTYRLLPPPPPPLSRRDAVSLHYNSTESVPLLVLFSARRLSINKSCAPNRRFDWRWGFQRVVYWTFGISVWISGRRSSAATTPSIEESNRFKGQTVFMVCTRTPSARSFSFADESVASNLCWASNAEHSLRRKWSETKEERVPRK